MALKHIIRDVKSFFNIGKLHKQIKKENYQNILESETLNAVEKGVSNEIVLQNPIVVSLTTYGQRINTVYLSIASVMRQSLKANRIILWLSQEEFKNKCLPATLRLLEKKGLEIRYCEDIRSYKKLIPTLKLCPDSIIITIDDDCMYDIELIDRLVRAHIDEPETVWANRVHLITKDKNGKIRPYKKWQTARPNEESDCNMATGVGGVLYPPNIFTDEILDEKKFMSLAPTADDIWFKAMELNQGIKVKRVKPRNESDIDDYIGGLVKYSHGLANENVNKGRNDKTVKALSEYFDKIK